jgi:hypothetical protein
MSTNMSTIGQALSGLRDVEGVYGSFVITQRGALLGRDLPAMFDERLFAELGPRIERLTQALGGEARRVQSCVLRFSEHKLHVRYVGRCIFGVVTSAVVNAATLRMALTLISRRLEAELPAQSFAGGPDSEEPEPLSLRRPSSAPVTVPSADDAPADRAHTGNTGPPILAPAEQPHSDAPPRTSQRVIYRGRVIE